MTTNASTLLPDRAVALHRERQEKYKQESEQREREERERLVKSAIAYANEVLGMTVSSFEVDGSMVVFSIDGLRIGYMSHRDRSYSHRQWDQLYIGLTCPESDCAADPAPGFIYQEFHGLDGLGEILEQGLLAREGRRCWACQERDEYKKTVGDAASSTPTNVLLSPLERLGVAIEDVVNDTIRRAQEG